MKNLVKKLSFILSMVCVILILPKIAQAQIVNKGTVDKFKDW